MKQRLHPDDLEFYLKSNEKRLYRLAYSYMHSDADAKDMLQNAILKAFTGLTRLKNMEYMDTWFYRILINTCLDQIRKQRRESVYPLEEDICRSIPTCCSVRSFISCCLHWIRKPEPFSSSAFSKTASWMKFRISCQCL